MAQFENKSCIIVAGGWVAFRIRSTPAATKYKTRFIMYRYTVTTKHIIIFRFQTFKNSCNTYKHHVLVSQQASQWFNTSYTHKLRLDAINRKGCKVLKPPPSPPPVHFIISNGSVLVPRTAERSRRGYHDIHRNATTA